MWVGVLGAVCVGVLWIVGCGGDEQSDSEGAVLQDCVGVIQTGIGGIGCEGILQDGSVCEGVLQCGTGCAKVLDDAGSVFVGVLQIGADCLGVSQPDTGLDGVLETYTGCVGDLQSVVCCEEVM